MFTRQVRRSGVLPSAIFNLLTNEAVKQYESQEQLGKLAEVNLKYIGEVERMEKNILLDALASIATVLKVRCETW